MRKCRTSPGGPGPKRTSSVASYDSRMRVLVLRTFFMVGGGLIFFRLLFLQVATHDKWVAMAQDLHGAEIEITADRGEVFIDDGGQPYPLAVNREIPTVYLVPKEVTDPERVASELSRILQVDRELLVYKMRNREDPFEIVKKRISDHERAQISELKLAGVKFLPEKYRYYPAGELASHVIGFASLQDNGKVGGYGIEASMNTLLLGSSGNLQQEKDAAGRWLPLTDRKVTDALHGANIYLTLDRNIQFETEKIMHDAVEKYASDRASAIVMDPKTGRILAMASSPQFDPNKYREVEDYADFLNTTLSLAYEPGSIMKPITMAIGLEEGKVTPDSEFSDPGVISIGGFDIRNAEDKTYGQSSMYKVLEESINTGVIYVERQVGNEAYRDYMKRFGFGEKTGVELPAELSGDIRSLERTKQDIQFYTASFGQGITTTPMQMVQAYGAMANRGVMMKPQIISRIEHADGRIEEREPEKVRQVLGEKASEDIGKMLRTVVTKGHGKRADVPGYLVGGKTGTAQVAKSGSKGYEEGLTIGSFIGYAPIQDPQFVVLVKLDNPKNVEWAESSAAPAFGEIMHFLLEYAKIPPTEEIPSTK
jgi:cell division protein FtsI/penicillin-binding protein 2